VSLSSFGLRPRLLAALLLTSAVTLAVAALALLSPLEQRFRSDGESGVFQAIGAARPEFEEIRINRTTGQPDQAQLEATTSLLRHRASATVTLLDAQLSVVFSGAGPSLNVPNYYGQARRALKTGRGIHALVGDELVAAEPIMVGNPGGRRYVLVLMRRLQYVAGAVAVVQKAFLEAAGAGLGIALLLGIGLTTTLLRRLERLRNATRELERRGLEAPLPEDGGHDEIGDLARTFASMQSRLRRQEIARRAFVATASHELRTPLASLEGMLELLEDDLSAESLDLEDARERTAHARAQSRRLSHLASDLLDLSRLDAEVELRSEPLELGELTRAVTAEFELRAAERQVAIDAVLPAQPCWVAADPGAVARIVRILLDNSLRVAPPGSSIDMSIVLSDQWTRVIVSDYGPGVPALERDRIFERFQRGSATGGQGGFGLGLAIGRELAIRMDGTLELLADPPAGQSHGACFTLSLPATQIGEETSA
jgi:signal transduction histidine kinase